jgi:hypothetical protein
VLAAARKRGYMAQFSGVDKRHPKMADKGNTSDHSEKDLLVVMSVLVRGAG